MSSRAAIIFVYLALAACANPTALNSCPPVTAYTTAQQDQASKELAALPTDSVLRTFMNDYHRERVQLLACRS